MFDDSSLVKDEVDIMKILRVLGNQYYLFSLPCKGDHHSCLSLILQMKMRGNSFACCIIFVVAPNDETAKRSKNRYFFPLSPLVDLKNHVQMSVGHVGSALRQQPFFSY